MRAVTWRDRREANMQTNRFDAIVIGSGASGGWAAKRLSEAGIKVALLEAGRPQTGAEFTEHVPAYDLKYRDQASEWMRRTRPRQRDCYACREWNYKWFVNDLLPDGSHLGRRPSKRRVPGCART
jgi:glucoside 3-dehydrogenase (cytochrome c) catalytic subunit